MVERRAICIVAVGLLLVTLLPPPAGAAPPGRTVSISDVSVEEGNSGAVNAVFTVVISSQSGPPATVTYAAADGTAAAAKDYQATSGVLTFQAPENTRGQGTDFQQIVVPIIPDTLNEDNENFVVRLSNPTNVEIADGEGKGTILDDDPLPILSVSDPSVAEGNEGTTPAVFTVLLTPESGRTVTVAYATADGTAGAGGDYTATSATLSFAPGERTREVVVPVLGDRTDEDDETFFVNLSSSTNAVIGNSSARGTILDDDAAPILVIDDVFLIEPDAGTAAAVFTLQLSPASERTVTVDFATADGTAKAGPDYTAANGTLTFAPGETTKQVPIQVVGDTTDEPDETFVVNLSNGVNATLADPQGQGTILNNDPAPRVAIDDLTVTEGETGRSFALFTVTLSQESGKTVTVDYATQDGTAHGDHDYVFASGTLNFGPGETSKQIVVPILGDAMDEDDEVFFVNLTGRENATIADPQGVATIVDDDPEPSVSIDDVQVTEGHAGPARAAFTVRLSGPSGKTVEFTFGTIEGTATAGIDYTPASGTLTFGPGDTSATITVTVNGDTLDEPDEQFRVALSGAVNAAIVDGEGLGTIVDDDPEPSLSINDVSALEGAAGTADVAFAVTLSEASGKTVSVDFATADGTAKAALADYLLAAGTLTFAPGQRVREIVVKVNGDTLDEPDETFFVSLSNAANAALADAQGQGTILNDDVAPLLAIDDATIVEDGLEQAQRAEDFEDDAFTFPVTGSWSRSTTAAQTGIYSFKAASIPDRGSSEATFTINYPANSTNRKLSLWHRVSSECGFDFLRILLNGTLVRSASCQSTWTFFETTAGLKAGDNFLTVRYSKDCCIAGGQDTAWVDNITQTYDTPVGQEGIFTVRLSEASGKIVTVDFATADGSALAGVDYLPVSGTVTFAPGEVSQQIRVAVKGDALDEPDETFFVSLSNAANATLADAQGQGTILDDDPAPSLSINDVAIAEGNSGTKDAIFTASLSAPSGRTVTVDFATADGSANAGPDYVAASGSLTFAPGATSRQITIQVIGDAAGERDETFFVNLSTPTNATIIRGQGRATIINDDPVITISDAFVFTDCGFTNCPGMWEGDRPDDGTAAFVVHLSHGQSAPVTVDFATVDGSATSPADFVASLGTLIFNPGETQKTIGVRTNGDTRDEPDLENFFVNLSNARGADIGIIDSQGEARIIDDDPNFILCFLCFTFTTEGGFLLFLVETDRASDVPVAVSFETQDTLGSGFGGPTATPVFDYEPVKGGIHLWEPPPAQQSFRFRFILVRTVDDRVCEREETVFVRLFLPVNAQFSSGGSQIQLIGTIFDNDCFFF